MNTRSPVILRDPETTARLLREQHGDEAFFYSAQMLGEAVADGNEFMADRWRRVINALDGLDSSG